MILRVVTTAVSALVLTSAAAAGPEWVEGTNDTGDAGALPGGAQRPEGFGLMTTIEGQLEGLEGPGSFGDPAGPGLDFEDMFLIEISDPAAFSATTVDAQGGFAEFDTVLWLFDAESALGLLANNDTQVAAIPLGNEQGKGTDSGSTLGNMSTDGTGIVLGPGDEGLYLLAITQFPNEAVSEGGPIFFFGFTGEVSGPDGNGGGGAVVGWSDGGGDEIALAGPGSYRIVLTGVSFPAPLGACCFADGSCLVDTEAACGGLGGAYQDDFTTCADVTCAVAPAGGADRVSATEKGSLLFFPNVELRWSGQPPHPLIQDTFIDLANDFPADVRVQLYFVNGDAPLEEQGQERAHPGWNWIDNVIQLTGDEPTYWSASTGQPKGVSPLTVLDPGSPPGRPATDGTNDRVLRGYAVAWAVDHFGNEVRWNHLKGDATVVNYQIGYAWEYNAFAVAVVADVENGAAPDGSPGEIRMNGIEYAPIFDQLLLDFYATGHLLFSDTDVTLHPASVDLRQETGGPITTKAHYDVWNMDEVHFSGAYRCVTCWDQTLLSRYGTPNHFGLISLGTDKGRARIDGLASQLCDFDFDLGDGLPLGDDPRDVVSTAAALLGVQVKLLEAGATIDRTAGAGMNLHGSGTQEATILYDAGGGGPPEQQGPSRH